MTPACGRRVTNRRCGPLRVRLARVSAAALAALTVTEITLTIGNGVLHLTPAAAALAAWLPGAVVSYGLSRWVRSREGRPDLLNETIPFWAISVLMAMLLALVGQLGCHSAAGLHFTGAANVLWTDLIWLPASLGALRLQFAIFHCVLFADRPAAPRPVAPPLPSPAARPGAGEPRTQLTVGLASAASAPGESEISPTCPGWRERLPGRREDSGSAAPR